MHSICSCPEKSASPGALLVPDTTLDMRSMDMPEHGRSMRTGTVSESQIESESIPDAFAQPLKSCFLRAPELAR